MHKKIIIVILTIVVIFIGSAVFIFIDSDKRMQNIRIIHPDLSLLDDGVYEGSCDLNVVKVVVAVTISQHQIKDIQIIQHDNGMGAKAEAIIDTIVDENTLDVDVVSGATMSSKAIVKAVENALT